MADKNVGQLDEVGHKKINPKDFVHLHNHSHASLLDGLQKIPEMLDRVLDHGMSAVALTDHGTLSGAIEFYKEAKSRGIKPIIGMEAYMAPRKLTDKEGKKDANPSHLTILAKNNAGYQNLMELASISNLKGFYYKPRIDRATLKKYKSGLIVLSGCINGELGDAIRNNQIDKAKDVAIWYKNEFGEDYYLEIQDHGHEWEEQKKANNAILKLGKELKIPVVVTDDSHYTLPTDQDAHEVLLCVQTGAHLEDKDRMSLADMHLDLSSGEVIANRWAKHPEVVANTKKVADKCSIKLEFGKLLIPNFPTPNGEGEHKYLEKLAWSGLAGRYGGVSLNKAAKLNKAEIKKLVGSEKVERLQKELTSINKMGFAGYFLIVADFINWAKEQGIIIGPGRGSAAGSIVSYCLGITNIEPLKYNLLFERFLNPERISMPDIDIDFQDDRRDEVIDYVVKKYGEDRVAHIVTFGRMAARNAIRDTARVLGVPYADADRFAKMVPPPQQGRHTPLKKHIKDVPELAKEYKQNQTAKKVFDLAIRLEGTIRSHGVHAAGVVIAPDKITKYTPLEVAQKGVVATQYPMGPIEDLGLLKMDFLGLSNLTIIKNALRIIRKVYGKDIDIYKIPIDDAKTFKLLSRGETTGVFQLESAGMKRYLKQLKPNEFSDIIAMVSLYRPGPIAEISHFIEGKNDKSKITYPHPSLAPILKDTYGVMVYQEQIIAMLQLIADYTPGEADLVRKAIGKKKRDIMESEKPRFIKGCQKQGLSMEEAENLWKLIQPFADYSFNKSHAACYGLIAYQTAYLKANYPSAFMAALLTSDHGDTDRVAIEVAEAKRLGIDVLPPDINESFTEFAIVPKTGAIRFGLAAIKNVGTQAAEAIQDERAKNGAYKSVEDFAKRVSPAQVNRKTWESLIKVGAFDSLDSRDKLLHNLDLIMALAGKMQKQSANGQVDLFGGKLAAAHQSMLHMDTPAEQITDRERLRWERELLGFYLSKHPLDEFATELEGKVTKLKDIGLNDEGRRVAVAGFVSSLRKIVTKNGASMAFVGIEDTSGSLELIVFPKLYTEANDLWEVDNLIIATGKVSSKDREGRIGTEIKLLADTVVALNQQNLKSIDRSKPTYPRSAAPGEKSRLVIQLNGDDMSKLSQMRQKLGEHEGETEVIIVVGGDKSTQIRLPIKVNPSQQLKSELEKLFSNEAVVIES